MVQGEEPMAHNSALGEKKTSDMLTLHQSAPQSKPQRKPPETPFIYSNRPFKLTHKNPKGKKGRQRNLAK